MALGRIGPKYQNWRQAAKLERADSATMGVAALVRNQPLSGHIPHAEQTLAGLFPDCRSRRPVSLASRRRPRCLPAHGGQPVRHGARLGRSHGAAVRHADAVAGLPAHRRRRRDGGKTGPAAGAAVRTPDAGGTAQPPRHWPDHAELRRQRPGVGQRSHANRPARHAGTAIADPHAGHRQQRADPLPGAERLVADPAAGHALHVPCATGCCGPDAGVPAHPAGHQRIHARGLPGGRRLPAAAPDGPGRDVVAGWRGADHGRLHGAAGQHVGRCHRHAVVAAGQPDALWHPDGVPDRGRLEEGAGLRGLHRRRQGSEPEGRIHRDLHRFVVRSPEGQGSGLRHDRQGNAASWPSAT
ncbi:hypothetical protein G6F68_010590 [Rhizopus microsporus]|nr:hypothetical protein G6F68_010590 [Rhizopus microsporus]